MGRLSNGVRRRHPVIMQTASLIAVLMMQVCMRHQTDAQYSAVEYTRAKVAVL